ncbi:MAG: SdiA-regulated domain-containing protein [Gemmatimonadota bacterium]
MRFVPLLAAVVMACDAQPESEQARVVEGAPDSTLVATPGAASTVPGPNATDSLALGVPDVDPPRVEDGDADDSSPAPGEQTSDPWLDRYDFEDRLWYVDLPGRLDEVSGLAFTPDGRLFGHDDERGRVHQIDPGSGEVGMRFDLGDPLALDDFEGIAVVGERFFMVSSLGLLYEFREGSDREDVEYRVTDPGIGSGCEVEGLDHDPVSDALLFPCKTTTPRTAPIEIRRVSMGTGDRMASIRVDRDALPTKDINPDFAPSGIVGTPIGTWLVLSARDDAIIEIDGSGTVLAGVELRSGRHPQSEGIALSADGTLYVADEKNGKEPRITAYAPRREESR